MKNRKKDAIEHLDDVDVYVDPRPMTKEEEEMISKYIQEQKRKNLLKGKKQKNKRAA
jgi:hypothetical protein